MSERLEIAHRRLLPMTVVAYLLAAMASQLTTHDGVGVPDNRDQGVQMAGVHVSLGFLGHGHYRGHHGHYRGHHRYYRPYRHHYSGYHPYRYAHPHAYYHGAYSAPKYASRHFGGLDLNVKPKKTTQVYIDGNYVGLTGNFDGWPEHLWLEAFRRPAGGTNTYELILYNPGYQTVVRQVELQPGVVIRIHEDMQPGDSIPPEELSTVKRSSGPPTASRTETKPAAPQDRQKVVPTPAPAPRPRVEPSPQKKATATPRPGVLDARQQPATLKLSVAPADASVYLDGHFLGVAGEIGEQRSGILVDPGEHRLEIVRPGHTSRELSFDAEPGGEVELEVELATGASRTGFST